MPTTTGAGVWGGAGLVRREISPREMAGEIKGLAVGAVVLMLMFVP